MPATLPPNGRADGAEASPLQLAKEAHSQPKTPIGLGLDQRRRIGSSFGKRLGLREIREMLRRSPGSKGDRPVGPGEMKRRVAALWVGPDVKPLVLDCALPPLSAVTLGGG